MNRWIASRGFTTAAWCAVVAAVVLRGSGRAPLLTSIVAAAATALLVARLLFTVAQARRGQLAWTRLPLSVLVTAEGALHALAGVRGSSLEGAAIGACELALLGAAIVVTARAVGTPGDRALLEERITAALARFVPERIARVAALEIVIVRFAFGLRGAPPAGSDLFAYATESPLRLFVVTYPLLLLVNEVAVQALIPPHFPVVRAVAAALDVYGFVWLLGVYRSMVARPHRLEGGRLCVHRGLLGSAVLDAAAVETATTIDSEDGTILTSRFPGAPLRLDVGGPRRVLLTLRRPVTCQGFLGARRATRILISADQPDALCDALRKVSAGAVCPV